MSISRQETPPSSGQERRKWHRAQVEWPITIAMEDGTHQARIRDISRGGVCFFLDRPLKEMTVLRMEFDLPVKSGRRTVSGTGAVVRCEKISAAIDHYEIAVFMQEMAEPDRETIAEYVASQRS